MLKEINLRHGNDVEVMMYVCQDCIYRLEEEGWTITKIFEADWEGPCDGCDEDFYYGSLN